MGKEQNLDFDKIVERRGTDCLKYDWAVKRGKPADILPLWVADMDFQTSSRIVDAIKERADHAIYGYSEAGESYFEALANWMKERHDWEVKPNWVVKTPGVVFALAIAVRTFTEPGDSVLIQQPVYYPFKEVIEQNGRTVVSSDLVLNEETRHYEIDFEDFEQKIVDHKIKLFLFCNPHNPGGRVWTKEELEKLGDICLKHNVLVVSDEIHQDFVFAGHKHVPFASIKEEFAQNSIICTAPSKTFNLAALQISNIFIPNATIRRKFRYNVNADGYSQQNIFGIVACEAAYREGGEWYEAMLAYVTENLNFFESFIEENLPKLHVIRPEGTYLVWVDLRELGLSVEEEEDLIVNKANLWLDSGSIFGAPGNGFERFNIACPRSILKQALDQLKEAIEGLS